MKLPLVLNAKCFWCVFIIYSLVLYLQYFGSDLLIYIISIPLIGLLFLNFRSGILILITLLFIFDDLPFDLKNPIFYSIHKTSISGQTMTKLISVLLIILTAYGIYKRKKIPKMQPFIYVLAFLFISGIITGLLKGNHQFLPEFVNDVRFYLNFFLGLFISFLLFFNNGLKYKFLELISLVMIVKSFWVILLHFFVFKGNIYSDTTFYFSNFFFLFLAHQTTQQKGNKIFLYFGLCLIFISLALSASRGKIFLFGISIFTYLILTKKLKHIPTIIISCLVIGLLMYFFMPSSFEYLTWKLSTFLPDENNGKSSYVRFVEFHNIITENLSSFLKFIFGEGFGGYFTTEHLNFPFDVSGKSSYPEKWIQMGKFFKPHGSLSVMLLKHGFGGIILLYSTLIGIIISSTIRFGKKHNLILVFAACIIPIFLISYSAKQNLFAGILVGVLNCLIYEAKDKKSLSC